MISAHHCKRFLSPHLFISSLIFLVLGIPALSISIQHLDSNCGDYLATWTLATGITLFLLSGLFMSIAVDNFNEQHTHVMWPIYGITSILFLFYATRIVIGFALITDIRNNNTEFDQCPQQLFYYAFYSLVILVAHLVVSLVMLLAAVFIYCFEFCD